MIFGTKCYSESESVPPRGSVFSWVYRVYLILGESKCTDAFLYCLSRLVQELEMFKYNVAVSEISQRFSGYVSFHIVIMVFL